MILQENDFFLNVIALKTKNGNNIPDILHEGVQMLLEIKDLVYKASDRIILDHISLKVDKGESIAIIGPSGSGKSTFQKQICNLISPTSGELYFKR